MQRFIDLRRGKKAQKIVLIAHRDHGYVEHRSDSSVVLGTSLYERYIETIKQRRIVILNITTDY